MQPFFFELTFTPPFESKFEYSITYGHGNSPVNKLHHELSPEELLSEYSRFVRSGGNRIEATNFNKLVINPSSPREPHSL